MNASDLLLSAFTPRAGFHTTHWSEVLAAGSPSSPRAREALEHLCRAYWFPLYAYVRRLGYPSEDAKDLTQGFFLRIACAGRSWRGNTRKGPIPILFGGCV